MNPDGPKLTCEKGCGKCCDVGGTDKILLATAEEAEAIGRVIGKVPSASGKSFDQIQFGRRREYSCPFLEGGSCGVYRVRPMICRMYQCDLSDPATKSDESIAEIAKGLNELIAQGAQFADLREWFPPWLLMPMGEDEGIPHHPGVFFI